MHASNGAKLSRGRPRTFCSKVGISESWRLLRMFRASNHKRIKARGKMQASIASVTMQGTSVHPAEGCTRYTVSWRGPLAGSQPHIGRNAKRARRRAIED